MAESRTGAEYIAEAFEAYGITDVFFMEAILRRSLHQMEKRGIRRVMAHTEKAAAYMADGYARATGKVGVCMAQSVGAANLAAGLQDAYLARSPIVALTGHKAIPHLQRNAYQEIAHPPMFQPVTRFSANVEEVSQLPFLLRQAFREATGPTPRPAHLDLAGLSGEVVDAATVTGALEVDPRHGRAPAYRTAPDPADIEAAAKLIDAAERPVAFLGAGAVLAGAGEEAQALAALGIPIAYGLDGKGLVSDTAETTIGPVGHYSAPYANKAVHEADLVIYVGSDTSDQATESWRVPAPGTRIVQIDADHAELGRNYPGALGICADCKLGLRALVERLRPRENGAWVARVAGLRRDWEAGIEAHAASTGKPATVERLCREITGALPEDAMLVADTGFSGIWTGTQIHLNGAGQGYMRAAGSLGWGFPAAIGAQCGLPDRPVVCFCGDGAFYYHLSELETARRWNIPVTVVVNNNSAFGQDIVGVRQVYGQDNGRWGDLTNFAPVNFAAVAESFGCKGVRVEDPADLGDALRDAIRSEEPRVVDVATDSGNRAPDAWVPST
jgi:acetolactate synthase I/II/III large subunit